MTKNKLILATSAFALVGIVALSPISFAQEDTTSNSTQTNTGSGAFGKWRENFQNRQAEMQERQTERQANIEERQAEREVRKYELVTQRCERITTNIQSRIDRFNSIADQRVATYEKVKERVKGIEEQLAAAGYDTSELQNALVELDALIVEHWNQRKAIIATLQESQEYACGESEGEFKSRVQASRDQVAALRESGMAIRDFFRDTIRPIIQELREQELNDTVENSTENN